MSIATFSRHAPLRALLVITLLLGSAFPAIASSLENDLISLCRISETDPAEIQALLDKGADPNDGDSGRPLFACVARKRYDLAKLLLENDADPNILAVHDNERIPALQLAAELGYYGIAGLLLEHEADPDIVNSNGVPAWFFAAAAGEKKVLEAFLEHGVNFNLKSAQGEPGIMLAALYGQAEAVKFLADNGADPNLATDDGTPPLVWTATKGRVPPVEALLAAGANPDGQGKDGKSALFHAAAQGNQELVDLLLLYKARPSVSDNGGVTAIGAADNGGHKEIAAQLKAEDLGQRLRIIAIIMGVATLLAGLTVWIIKRPPEGRPVDDPLSGHAFSVDKPEERQHNRWSGKTDSGRKLGADETTVALIQAVEKGHPAVVAKLLAQDANAEAVDQDGVPVVLLAVMSGNADMIAAFLRAGLDPNKARGGAAPLLFMAVEEGHSGIVRHLLSHHADPNTPYQGVPPLVRAAEQGHKEIVGMLLKAGAELEGRQLEDPTRTALQQAALRGQAGAVAVLMEKGASREAVDAAGATALQLAERGGHTDVVKLLKAGPVVVDPDGPPQPRRLF